MINEDEELYFSIDEQVNIINRCEQMFMIGHEMYFDVQELDYAIDYYLELQEFDKALTVCLVGERIHETSNELNLKKAKIYLIKEKPQKAYKILSQLTNHDIEIHELESLKGFCLMDLDKIDEAHECFDKAIAQASDSDINYFIASNLVNKEYFETAIKYLEQTFKDDTSNPFAIYDLAYCYEKIDQLEMSILFYQKYIELDPYSDNAWYNLGILFNRMEEYADAVEAFDYALAINEKNNLALFNKANTLANWGQYETAIEHYNEFLTKEPNNLNAKYYKGECFEKLEQYNDAETQYREILEIDPLYADAWHGMGVVAFYRQNLTEACQMLDKSIQIDCDNPEYWYSYGNIHKSIQGSEHKALYCYKRATELDPHDHEFWLSYAEMEKITGNTESAARTLEFASELLDEDAEFDFILSAYYYELGNKVRSLELFKKARGLDVEMATAFFSNCTLKEEDKKIYTTLITH